MNMIEYTQKARRLNEDIERYLEMIETTRYKLVESQQERMRLYHKGWTE